MYAIEPTAAVVVSRPACTFSFFLNNNKLIIIITYKLKLEKVLLKFFSSSLSLPLETSFSHCYGFGMTAPNLG